jgi:Holliday junction resolvase RusA-like endonuclease
MEIINKMINICYLVKPKPAPRPRVTSRVTYNAKDYTAWKNGLKLIAKTKMKKPLEGAVGMKVEFFYKIPKSWSKQKKADAKWHISRPDKDNLLKSVFDALNGVAFVDDSQVCQLDSRKQYAEFEGVKIEIYDIS